MMKKKKRTIVIKNHHLQNIRNNFREILIKTVQVERRKLTSEIDDIARDSEGKPRMNLTPSEGEELKRLKDIRSKINELTDKSICYCTACKQVNKDMAYNPALEKWYCVECYEEFRDYYYQQKVERQKGKFLGDYNEPFFETFR